MTGQLADGWIPSYGDRPLHQYQAMRQRVLTAAREAGRDPAGITCALHRQAHLGERVTGGPSLVAGPPAAVTEKLLAFAGIGFTSFSFTLTDAGTREQAERLAHEVIPAVRAVL